MPIEVLMSYEEFKYSDGSFKREWKDEYGLFHREDGPAIICYYPGGSISSESFYFEGRPHRELGPAQIWYNENGSIEFERFYVNRIYLGDEKEGFWNLWRILSDEKRQSPEILKCLTRYL
jgi:antitoxin component YwqK of YwqJK toxin-antitoxin module